MKTAARNLTTTKRGFVSFLLSLTVVQAQSDWRVTYSSSQICAVEGSTVDIPCSYTYPSRGNEHDTVVWRSFWFVKMNGNNPLDLRNDPDYRGRVEYHFYNNSCTLRITNVRQSDSAEYRFMLMTNQPEGGVTGSPGVTLSVTALQVQVSGVKWVGSDYSAVLTCHGSCRPTAPLSYIWYENGQKMKEEESSFSGRFHPLHSVACALKGYEDFPSPSVCVRGRSCYRVTYNVRTICALKGSSVNISCTYYSYKWLQSMFWFSPDRSHQWKRGTEPEDLSKDPQYAGRVQSLRGGWFITLRISELRESNSAQYHFKFKTAGLEWGNSFAGTTLTVTALQVKVISVTVHQDYTEAELRCHSSCSPAGGISYTWLKNGQKIPSAENSSHRDRLYPGDFMSCALKGLENYASPSVYALKTPSVWVSPLDEITKGSSVTLTCSSDANPAAKYTWYRKNQTLSSEGAQLVFSSIQSSDSAEYQCAAENQQGRRESKPVFIHVQYAPRLPSVSVSPSAEIMEGSSVNLTCSSDANPAANYTWYKENEDSPLASGQIFTICNVSAEHSGNYYCEAQNKIGCRNSTFTLTVVSGSSASIANISRITLGLLVMILLLPLILWRRKKDIMEAEPAEAMELNSDPAYENISAVTAAQREDREEQEDAV
ncbi:B-cell receptor CD22-like isoform X2 [Cheilinus undulatus]|uniref:B-cell receptor CD22-like isoform X2 n=1 Tax=Cheilinus undulatus TaxID=241271 RepID=UPI001BD3B01A|nr:B-cell receptor CD22-like isoform X2 [Cheilinus undulatus]